jgi:hypothetical protein
MLRRLSHSIPIPIAVAMIFALATPPSQAFNGNCSFNHCYSVKRAGTSSATGVIITLNNNNLTPGTSYTVATPFFNSEAWLVASNSSWVEAGISNGYNFTLGYWAYSFFTYTYNSQTDVSSGWVYLSYTTPNGGTHTFQISRAATTNRFSIWVDGTGHPPNFTSGNVSFWQGQPHVGGELYTSSANAHADTFNIYKWQVTTSGAITQWPTTGSTYAITSGFNGVNHGTFWSWNAP